MKLMKALVALLVAAGLVVPAVAMANDNFSVNGSMRVEGIYSKYDDGSTETKSNYFDQRFRFDTVYKVSDEVSARIRFDLEDVWGRLGTDTLDNAPGKSDAIQTDVAYLEVNKELWKLQAGQIFFSSPNAILADHTGTGFGLTIKTPVSLKLQYTKRNENGAAVAVANGSKFYTDEAGTDDTDFYSAQVGYGAENFSLTGIYAIEDNQSNDTDRSAFGLAATFKAGGVDFGAELDFLDGKSAAADLVGTQLYLTANTGLSDALNVGGWFMYVAGTDDANEDVIVSVTDDASFNPLWFGYYSSGIVAGLPISQFGPDDFIDDAGLVGGALNMTYKASADLGFKAQFAYATEEEDAAGSFDYTNLVASMRYKVATNTYFDIDAIFEDLDVDGSDEDSINLWTQLTTSF